MSQMPDKIKEKLAEVAPSIAFRVEWEVDPYYKWDGGGPDPRNRGQFPHDVTVTASAIVNGEMVVGQDNLGGCYEAPGKTCPDVHGYLLDMLSNALVSLDKKTPLSMRVVHSEIEETQKLIELLQKKQQEDWAKRAKKRKEKKDAQKA